MNLIAKYRDDFQLFVRQVQGQAPAQIRVPSALIEDLGVFSLDADDFNLREDYISATIPEQQEYSFSFNIEDENAYIQFGYYLIKFLYYLDRKYKKVVDINLKAKMYPRRDILYFKCRVYTLKSDDNARF